MPSTAKEEYDTSKASQKCCNTFRKNRKSVFIRIQNTSSDVGLQSQPPRLCPSCVKYFCQKHYGKHEECCPERLTRCSSLAGDMLEINTHLSTVLLSIGI